MQGLKFLLGNFVRNDISAPGPEAFVKYCMFFAVRLQDQWSMMNPSSIQPAVSFIWLVRWYTYPSENMSSSIGMSIPNWMENHKIHVPNHQPIYIFISGRDQPRLFPYCDELRLTISQRKYHSEPARCTSTLIWRREQYLVLLNARTAVLQDVNFLQLPIWRKWSEALYIGCWASGNFAIWDFSSRRHGNWRILVWCAYENSLNLRNWMGYHLVV